MSQSVEKRLEEIFRWYEYNKGVIPPENLGKRLDFTQKTIDCLFELIVLQAENIQALELRAGSRSRKLYLPNGVTVMGDLKKFG